MMSALLQKMRLVTVNGLALGEYPKEDDFVKSQLAGGIMTALITFSKEIHDRDLHSVNFNDRKIFFIPVDRNFIIIIETILDIEDDMLAGVIKEIKEKSSWLLSSCTPDNIDSNLADIIISELTLIFQRFELLHDMADMVDDIDLSAFQIVEFEIDPVRKPAKNSLMYFDIYEFISQLREKELKKQDHHTFILYLPSTDQAGIFILTWKNKIANIGGILVDNKQFNQLYSVLNGYRDQVRSMASMLPYLTKKSLLQTLENSQSVNNFHIPNDWLDLISFKAIQRLIDNPDKVVSAVITGKPVIIVGDLPLVRIIVASLSVFTQHRPAVISLLEEEIPADHFNIIGMREIPINHQDTIIVDVISGRITGECDTYHYFSQAIHQYSLPDAIIIIREELTNLVDTAISSAYPEIAISTLSDHKDVVIGFIREINPFLKINEG